MKISENILLFVAGIIMMFFASYIFPYKSDPQAAFCILLFAAGLASAFIGGVLTIFKIIDNGGQRRGYGIFRI